MTDTPKTRGHVEHCSIYPDATYHGATGDEISVNEWLAIRKEAGLKIDPETAEVRWFYGYTLDPYAVEPDLPEELQQIGREYFARSPESDIWVSFGDLPTHVRDALWEKRNPESSRSYLEDDDVPF